MSNSYLNTDDIFTFIDERTVRQLSTDEGAEQGYLTRVQAICDACAAKVDTYLTGRAELPITNTTALAFLKMLVADIVHGRLYLRRTDMPKAVMDAMRAAEDWLEEFKKGMVLLPGTDAAVPQLWTSGAVDGRSKWSTLFGERPTETDSDHLNG